MKPISLKRLPAFIALLTALIPPAAAQVQFQIKIEDGDNAFTIANGSTLTLNSEGVSQSTTIHATVTYRGSGTVDLPAPPSLIGSPGFTISGITGAPGNLSPGGSFKFDITFTPITSAATSAQVELLYREIFAASSPTTAPQTSTGLIAIGFLGTAPEFIVSYALPTDGNAVPLASGSTMVFTPTPINTSLTATVSIANRGSGPGKLTGITVSGAPFQPLGLPLFPVTISAGVQFNFSVRYTPRQIENSAGTMLIALGPRLVNVALAGSSVGTNLTYQVQRGTETTTVVPNQTISFDDTAVGKTSSVTVRVQNSGNADGAIAGISVTGPGFQLGDALPTPIALAPDAVTILVLNFVATQPGQFRGRLRVGNDNFDLSATALGPRLTFSYLTGSATVAVDSGGLVIFTPLQAGKKASVPFTVRNAGTSPATIASIGIQEATSAFTISDQPSLPATLAPDATFSLTITFAPAKTGFISATLRIDGQNFTLTGSGTLPSPLPDYRLTGPSGTVAPLLQPAVTLTLAASYPVALTGVLTLTIDPDGFGFDPAVQFATGGRTVGFTIPANTTQALFGGSAQIRLQTGSIASRMTITPSFAIADGVDITPTSPPSLQFVVASSAPVLTNFQVISRTAAGFVAVITGVTTPRSLKTLEFTFTPTAQFKVATTKLSINIAPDASLWFNSALSQSFGGQFQINIPFTFSSNQDTLPLTVLDSISVVATNEIGASNSLTLSLR